MSDQSIDPGESLATPGGTGRLGRPDPNGTATWGTVPQNGLADTSTIAAGQMQDGTGSRSR
jgi:hypothetical protein